MISKEQHHEDRTKSLVLLRHHLKALRLPTIGAECEKVATQAAADNADHLAYLLQLTELELLDREKRAAERRLKAARFPTIKTMDTFDFAARPSVNKVLIAELMRCEYIDKRENLLLVGNPGTGKSHLATALAAQACAKGYRVRFFRTTELITALIEARDERNFLRLKDQPGQARPAGARRTGLRARLQGRRRAALRRDLDGLRAHQPDRDHQPALRVLDRGPRIRTAHRGNARPAHPPVPDHRDQGRELPAQTTPRPGPAGPRSSSPPNLWTGTRPQRRF